MPVEIALQQRDAGAFHRDVGAGAHGDADIGGGQRRRVVDAVAGHRDDPPGLLQLCDHRALLIGQHLGLDIGRCRAAARRPSPWSRLSPVSMMTLMPSAASAFSASGVDALTGSAIANSPASLPSIAMKMTVAPSPRRRSACSSSGCGRRCRASARNFALPSTMVLPSTLPVAPLPVGESNSSTLPSSRLRSLRRPHDGVGQRMLAGALDAGRKPQDIALVESRRRRRSRPPSACLRSACRSCRPPACRSSPCAPALRRS